ncbi:MAG: 23S rRNA (adenine(2503)-C(2))-methyltransferase RlmN [Treponema sp.]|nr:23S rRNA (adenine(2503)-C(2))-methyltransferase RlmN [Treponema sp.]
MHKPALSGMSPEELAGLISPEPRFRATQIFKWIASGVSSFDEMGNLPLSLRKDLARRFLPRPETSVTRHRGNDGTVKLAIGFADEARVEAVLLADSSAGEPRHTACLSTQVGCPAGCVFCRTGSMGFARNLGCAEILEQLFLLGMAEGQDQGLPISNIVVMGMGEPFLNLEQLRKALTLIGDNRGLNYSHRRITVSTCGITGGIIDLADNGPAVRLALSLTTADEGLRRRLMPITAKYPLGEVKEALRYFQDRGGGRVTLEAVLLGGVNTRGKDAQDIAGFAQGLDATVNLIPWNPVKGLEFEGKPLREPSPAEAEDFAQRLKALGLNVTRRFRRGRGVMGACGQLGGTGLRPT